MDRQKQVLRMGATAVALAIALRIFSAGYFSPLGTFLERSGAIPFLVYLQTGRVVRYPLPNKPQTQPTETEPQAPVLPEEPVPEPFQKPVFSPSDMAQIGVSYRGSYRPDVEALLASPLYLSLEGEQPTVLIVHTHATESYEKQPGQDYVEDVPYRTRNEDYNMVSVGAEIARVLTAGGICVLHDRSFHDYPSYNGSYGNARASIQDYLRRYPSIQLVLDIHRDASSGANGQQLTTSATVAGQASAQIEVVVGTNEGGNYHPNWQENLALGLKLTTVLERQNPGITRPLVLRTERFNMDLSPGSLLIEVGAAGDTREKALVAATALAQGILALSRGT